MLVLNLEFYVSCDYNINLKIAFLCFMYFLIWINPREFVSVTMFNSLLNIVMDTNVHEYSMIIVTTYLIFVIKHPTIL